MNGDRLSVIGAEEEAGVPAVEDFGVGRRRPPATRAGVTRKATLAEADGTPVDFYITLNRYPDGRPCEVFAKATNGHQGSCDSLCRLFSLLLQHAVPLASICRQLERSHFPPFGMVPGLGFVRSFSDLLARWVQSQCAAYPVSKSPNGEKGDTRDDIGGTDAGGASGAGIATAGGVASLEGTGCGSASHPPSEGAGGLLEPEGGEQPLSH